MFDFRKALIEDLPKTIEYYQTVEGRAERFLKKSIDSMIEKKITLDKVSEMNLGLCHGAYDSVEYIMFLDYIPKDIDIDKIDVFDGIPNINEYTLIHSEKLQLSKTDAKDSYSEYMHFIQENDSIFEIIEKELKSEGFTCENFSYYKRRFKNLRRLIRITF